jgi:hypothetical protein
VKKKSRKPSAKEYTGKVIKDLVSPGSKSERSAVQLDTGDRKLLLRRKGGHPFHDDVIEALVGQRIKCQGFRKGAHLFLESWEPENKSN